MVRHKNYTNYLKKNFSNQYYFIHSCFHEAGHVIYGLLLGIKILKVEFENDWVFGSAYTTYDFFDDDKLKVLKKTDLKTTKKIIEKEIEMKYAGEAADLLYFNKSSGLKKLPYHISVGSSLDRQEISVLINKYKIVPAGKKRQIYKKEKLEKVTHNLNKYWDDVSLISHELFSDKFIDYHKIKNILLKKSTNKEEWLNIFGNIEKYGDDLLKLDGDIK